MIPAVIPVLTSTLAALANTLAILGPMAGNLVAILPRLLPYLEKGITILNTVVTVFEQVSRALGIFRPDEHLDELGERALQAAEKGITQDRFADFADYLDALRRFEIDPRIERDPLSRALAGLAIASHGILDKLGLREKEGELVLLVTRAIEYFTPEKLLQLSRSGELLAGAIAYFTGRLGGVEALEIEDRLLALDQELHPEKSKTALQEALYTLQDTLRTE